MTMPSIFDAPIIEPPNEGPHFDGNTYEPEFEFDRLNGQLFRVWHAMRDGRWRTLEQIAELSGGSIASVSARLRDLRKEKFGSFLVQRRRVKSGLWEYRVGGKGDGLPQGAKCRHCERAIIEIDRQINDQPRFVSEFSQGMIEGLRDAKAALLKEHDGH